MRWWIAYDVGMAVASKLLTMLLPHHLGLKLYRLLWMCGEPIGVLLVAGCVLRAVRGRKLPFYAAIPALAVQYWAFSFPDRWPGQWLQFEMHLVAFCYLVLGLTLVPTVKKSWTIAALCAFLLGTAAMYYPAPWAPFVREWLMWWQCGCYVAMAWE